MRLGKSKPSRIGDDPMREIDLMLLEGVMQQRNFASGAQARRIQTAALLIVLTAMVAILAHAVVAGERSVTAAVHEPTQDIGIGTRFDRRWFW